MTSKNPKTRIRIGKGTAEILANPDFSEWTLEELLGAKLNKAGQRGGRPPNVVPMERVREIARRLHTDDFLEVARHVSEIREYLLNVALGKEPADKERVAVCEWIYERMFGKAPIRVELEAQVQQTPTQIPPGLVTRTIVVEAESREKGDTDE